MTANLNPRDMATPALLSLTRHAERRAATQAALIEQRVAERRLTYVPLMRAEHANLTAFLARLTAEVARRTTSLAA